MDYLGDIVEVDLTEQKVSRHAYSTEMVRKYLSGFGFNVWYVYQNLATDIDACDPRNPLAISCGLLTGTEAPSSSRIHINARSPLSGLMGSSNAGGFWGVGLRSCNIQSLILKGRAFSPVFLSITPEDIKIEPADNLWGLDTRQTESRLRERYAEEKIEVMSIGRAGENRVRYACIMVGSDHSAGRTGMGAVLGAKQVKALVVRRAPLPTHKNQKLTTIVKEYVSKIKANTASYKTFSTYGSAGDLTAMYKEGVIGARNYGRARFEGVENLDGHRLSDYNVRKTSCYRCPVHCKADVEIPKGKYKNYKGVRAEYETSIALGVLCGLYDSEALLYLSNLCNVLGLDTISTGSVIAFAMECFERGIITTHETDGLILQWGDADVMEQMMYRIAERKGIGNTLAEGVRRAASLFGKEAQKYAYHNKGVEIYGCDPRGMMGLALSYAVSLRGGDFTSVYTVPEFRYSAERAEKEFGTAAAIDFTASEGKSALARKCMLVSAVIDSFGICKVPALSIIADFELKNEADLLQAITGVDLGPSELFRIGERIVTTERLFNLRCGATKEDDTLPEMFLQQTITEGPAAGRKVHDLQKMVAEFYHLMGWDPAGVPTEETLNALEIL